FESPSIAPDVAIAEETPQMDTALEIIKPISSSTFSFLHNQKAKYQTENTTTSDCTSPRVPALSISPNMIDVPSRINPILTNSSVANADFNHSGTCRK